jgi:hypothetical protein
VLLSKNKKKVNKNKIKTKIYVGKNEIEQKKFKVEADNSVSTLKKKMVLYFVLPNTIIKKKTKKLL